MADMCLISVEVEAVGTGPRLTTEIVAVVTELTEGRQSGMEGRGPLRASRDEQAARGEPSTLADAAPDQAICASAEYQHA
jgi:hypothetical protein